MEKLLSGVGKRISPQFDKHSIECGFKRSPRKTVMILRLSFFPVTVLLATALSNAEAAMAQAPEEVTNSIGMKLVLIPKGTFIMGSHAEDANADKDERQHEVSISQNFYLGMFEVTQAQYEKVMGRNPSYFRGETLAKLAGKPLEDINGSNHPVEQVSWDEAVEFCQRLSDLPEAKKARQVYRLPTEAEWEYACRAGTRTSFSSGDSLVSFENVAWYLSNSGQQSRPVGEKKPNAWRLYDMHGNVWEWCSDWYGTYTEQPVTDAVGPGNGAYRVARGGSWFRQSGRCRSACRYWYIPACRYDTIGFRVAMNPSPASN